MIVVAAKTTPVPQSRLFCRHLPGPFNCKISGNVTSKGVPQIAILHFFDKASFNKVYETKTDNNGFYSVNNMSISATYHVAAVDIENRQNIVVAANVTPEVI